MLDKAAKESLREKVKEIFAKPMDEDRAKYIDDECASIILSLIHISEPTRPY